MLVDAHAHLDIEAYDIDRSATIERARAEGVERIINVGLSSQNWEKSLELVRQYPGYMYLALGIHPNDIGLEADPAAALLKLEQLCRANPAVIIGLGETGLDYYHKDVSPTVQQDFFERQIQLAQKLALPLILHCRDAMPDLLDILEHTARNMPIMMHCFSGSVAEAERSMALGNQVYISIAGPVTFAKATDRHEVVRAVPLERLLTETDCPFLTPHPFRGKRNEPARVKLVAQKIAELKNLAYAEVIAQTGANVQRLFRIA
jgi:TatD DNase family protein